MNRSMWIALGLSLIQLAFVVAKLSGDLHWSWALVLLPLWGPVVLAIIAAVIGLLFLSNESASGGNPFQ